MDEVHDLCEVENIYLVDNFIQNPGFAQLAIDVSKEFIKSVRALVD